MPGRRYPKEEFARRGDEIYERVVRPKLKPKDKNAFVAIDIETEDFEIGRDAMAASKRLHSRAAPDAQVMVMRADGGPVSHFRSPRPIGKKALKGRDADMPDPGRRYPKEEFARRGDEIYERVVRPTLKPKDHGAFVAIDIETEEFEISRDELAVGERLRKRSPNAQLWLTRAGSRYLFRIAGRGIGDQR